MSGDFFSQYKDPRWQKLRLEALSASDFHCTRCGDGENELHVHHRRYVKGRSVWDYKTKELDVLCRGCHEETHHDKEVLQEMISRIEPNGLSEVIEVLAGYCSVIYGPAQTDMRDGVGYTGPNLPYLSGIAAAAIANTCRKEVAVEVFNAISSRSCEALDPVVKSLKKD